MLQWKNCAAGFADSTKNTNRENALDYSLGGKSIYVYSYSNKHIEVGNSHNGYLSGAIKFIWIAIGQKGESMDLKQNITETNNLKNNVKIINNQINETIVRGGVTLLIVQPKNLNGLKVCQEIIKRQLWGM